MSFQDNVEILKKCESGPFPSIWELVFAGIAWSAVARDRIGWGIALATIAAFHWILRRLLAIRAQEEIRFLRDYMERISRTPERFRSSHEYMAEHSVGLVAKWGIVKAATWWSGVAIIGALLLVR